MVEVTVPHTGLLRLGLAPAASVTFRCRATLDEPSPLLARRALEEEWFPALSEKRVRYIVGALQKRFPYPARRLLGFKPREPERDQLVCHWHLQLTDPLYRDYTSSFLLERWSSPSTAVDLPSTVRWLRGREIARGWSDVTVKRMASALLGAAAEAGLCTGAGPRRRDLRLPRVTPQDVAYLEELLKLARARKKLDSYLVSVGQSRPLPEGSRS